MNKDEVVRILVECGDILEISGAGSFQVRAYSNGARALESWQGDLETLVKDGQVTSIRGIGKGLAALIEQLVVEDAQCAEFLARRDMAGLQRCIWRGGWQTGERTSDHQSHGFFAGTVPGSAADPLPVMTYTRWA